MTTRFASRIVPTPIVMRALRHMLLAEEVARRVLAGDAVEGDEARAAAAAGAGFVEADVPGASDAEDLQVDAACVGDRLLVGGARGGDLRLREDAVGDVHVLGTMSTWSNRCSCMKRR